MNNSADKSKHVFISFSTEDRSYADKIIRYLQKFIIPVWIDYKNIVPGTVDWDIIIKDAIQNSAIVLLLVSPNSIQSPYVKGEVAVAKSHKVAVIPVWIHGKRWVDCAPLDIIVIQYLDLRGSRFRENINQLDDLLLPYTGPVQRNNVTLAQGKKKKQPLKKILLIIIVVVILVFVVTFGLFSLCNQSSLESYPPLEVDNKDQVIDIESDEKLSIKPFSIIDYEIIDITVQPSG